MSPAHHDTNGCEMQTDTDTEGWGIYLVGLALALVAGLVIGFAIGRFG